MAGHSDLMDTAFVERTPMNRILLKRNGVTNHKPAITDLQVGEVAINTADLKIFSLSADGNSVVQLAGYGFDHGQLSNLVTGDPHTQYAVLSPGGSAGPVSRNTIASTTDAPELIIKRFSGQTQPLTAWQDEGGVVLASITNAGVFSGSGAGLTALNASNIFSGTVPTSRLGLGTASNTTFLRGDNTWQPVPMGPPAGADTQVQFNMSGVLSASSQFSFDYTNNIVRIGSLNINQGAITVGSSALYTTSTWNNATISFINWFTDVTDTASQASSLLMDLRVGGFSKFKITKTGAAIGASFNGDGSALANLNASNLFSGTVPIARLGGVGASGSTFLRGDNVWATPPITAPAGIDGYVQFNSAGSFAASAGLTFATATGILSATKFSGDGSAITNLNATNLATGTVPLARLGAAGADTQVQFNNAGAFGANAALTFSSPTGQLTATKFSGDGSILANVGFAACGRITLSSSLSVTISDVTAATVLYYLPCTGNVITLWNNTLGIFQNVVIPDVGWSVSLGGLAANTNYDVFVQNNLNGTAALALGTAWTNDTTRAVNLNFTKGLLFLGTAANMNFRYVGTIRTNATAGQADDSLGRRHCWNFHNQVCRRLFYNSTPVSWTFTTPSAGTVTRAINNDATARVDFLVGGTAASPANSYVGITPMSTVAITAGVGNCNYSIGVSYDQISGFNFWNVLPVASSSSYTPLTSYFGGALPIGHHWFTLIEQLYNGVAATATASVSGNNYTGMEGYIWG
jgi:hypothetical protein